MINKNKRASTKQNAEVNKKTSVKKVVNKKENEKSNLNKENLEKENDRKEEEIKKNLAKEEEKKKTQEENDRKEEEIKKNLAKEEEKKKTQDKPKLTIHESHILTALEKYKERLKPKMPVVPTEGVVHQYTLYRSIRDVVEGEDYGIFSSQWTKILEFVNENTTGVFNHGVVSRYNSYWKWSNTELNAMVNLIHIIQCTANKQDITNNLKTLDIIKLVEPMSTGLSDLAKRNLIRYYKVTL